MDKGEKTEAADQFDKQLDLGYKTLDTESADTRYTVDKQKEINDDNNQNKIDQIKAQTDGEKEVIKLTDELTNPDGTTALSEEGAEVFKQVSKNINNDIVKTYGKKYELPEDYEIVQWNGGTDYKLNLPEGHVPSWWKTQIIRPILESSMSNADKGAVISSLFGANAKAYYTEVSEEMKKYGQLK